jgi:DNA-binding NarL/FixJ family response regulator
MKLDRRIVLVDDHALVRAGIRSLLESISGIEVIAEVGDGLEALEIVRRERPDAILLDIMLKGLNGLEVAERISNMNIGTRILMLSMHTGPEYVARALAGGALGYLFKDSAFEELSTALQSVLLGRRYLSKTIDPKQVEQFLQSQGTGLPELDVMTPRQRQVLQLIAEGLGTREIAERLHVSIKTVETHRAQLMERLNIRDVPGLVRFAIRVGIINIDH